MGNILTFEGRFILERRGRRPLKVDGLGCCIVKRGKGQEARGTVNNKVIKSRFPLALQALRLHASVPRSHPSPWGALDDPSFLPSPSILESRAEPRPQQSFFSAELRPTDFSNAIDNEQSIPSLVFLRLLPSQRLGDLVVVPFIYLLPYLTHLPTYLI